MLSNRIALHKSLLRLLLVSICLIIALIYLLFFKREALNDAIDANSKQNAIFENSKTDESIEEAFIAEEAVFEASTEPSFKFIHGIPGKRDAVIEYRNLCLDSQGLFYPSALSDINLPNANVAGSAAFLDIQFKPDVRASPTTFVRTDRVMFVLGGVWSYHLSHFFVNSFTPLVNVMNNAYGHTDWKDIPRDLFLANPMKWFDIDALGFTNIYGSRRDNPESTVCYDRVIVGLNSTCDCCGCEKDYTDTIVHEQTRDMVLSHHLTPIEFQLTKDRAKSGSSQPLHMIVVDRLRNRRILNLPEVDKFLTTRGISHQILEMEKLSFTDQVRIFALNATALLATHGNALGNGFWMPDNSMVFEVHSYNQGSAWFQHIFGDQAKSYNPAISAGPMNRQGHRLRYNVIKCKRIECSDGGKSSFNAGVHVELDKLDAFLDSLL